MRIVDTAEGLLADCDPQEERSLAGLTLFLLSARLHDDHVGDLRLVYQTRGTGLLCSVNAIAQVFDIAAFYLRRGYDCPLPADFPISDWGIFRNDRIAMTETLHLKARRERILIWQEEYNRHLKLQQWAEFRPFVGQSFFDHYHQRMDELKNYDGQVQMDREVAFFKEVRRVQDEYGVDFFQAEIAVADYMPRGIRQDGTVIEDYRTSYIMGKGRHADRVRNLFWEELGLPPPEESI